MKKIIFMGRSRCGKTTLTQVLRGENIGYHKTQYVNHHDMVIDTPGEYAENLNLAAALALYAYEADVVGLMINASENYSLFPPNVTSALNRDFIGIVSQIDRDDADINRAHRWLELAGCRKIFHISSYTGEGVESIINYLTS